MSVWRFKKDMGLRIGFKKIPWWHSEGHVSLPSELFFKIRDRIVFPAPRYMTFATLPYCIFQH